MKKAWPVLFSVVLVMSMAGCAILDESAVGRDTSIPVKSSEELYDRALTAYQAGRYAEARERFHQYLGEYPDTVLSKVVLYYLGHCYQMLGEVREAEVLYSRVVDSYGDDDFWGAQAMKRLQQIKDPE